MTDDGKTYSVNRKVCSLEELVERVALKWDKFSAAIFESDEFIEPAIHQKVQISINLYFLTEALENARVDLSRWVDFHLPGDDGKMPDNHKYAGFVSRWIAKARPIQVVDVGLGGEGLPEYLYQINAAFACYIFRSYLDERIPHPMIKELIYRFHFRDVSGVELAMLAYTCEVMSRAQSDDCDQSGMMAEINPG